METIIICLLVLAVALLLYVIRQGKKDKNNVRQNEDSLAGLPDIIGRPKAIPAYSSPSTTAQDKKETAVNTTGNFNNGNEATSKISEIPQEGPDAVNTKPDFKEEEQEMQEYAASGKNEDFATGITFDELAIVQEMLARQSINRSEEKTAAAIVSKIDGSELLGLLESKIGDASKKIATLLERHSTESTRASISFTGKDQADDFDIQQFI